MPGIRIIKAVFLVLYIFPYNQMSQAATLLRGLLFFDDHAIYLTVVWDDGRERRLRFRAPCPSLQRVHDVLETVVEVVDGQPGVPAISPDVS